MSEQKPTGYKCVNCGRIHYPKHIRCLSCKHQEFEKVELPTEGKLVTFTHLTAPPKGLGDKRSITLGIIDLGPVRYTGQIHIDPKELELGMKVKGKWERGIRKVDETVFNGFIWIKP